MPRKYERGGPSPRRRAVGPLAKAHHSDVVRGAFSAREARAALLLYVRGDTLGRARVAADAREGDEPREEPPEGGHL